MERHLLKITKIIALEACILRLYIIKEVEELCGSRDHEEDAMDTKIKIATHTELGAKWG